ncbi:unnamed protein product [Trifolium pratense]|uniref:Uncharacterized protein n=1 Tax=Trifolium pratense TaxID=57577 RepID=A0ACB0LG61_TRIPR|nr:unnamed protein product [Trifolium pratense]
MVKQKIVIKVQLMNTSKARSNAMKIAVGMLAIGGDNKDQIEVIGEMDPIRLTNLLRKRFCRAELLSVEEKKEEKKKEEKVVPCSCPPYGYPAIPMCVTYPCEEPSHCSIM